MTSEATRPAEDGGPGGDAVPSNHSIQTPATRRSFGVTLGAGNNQPQGRWHELPEWSASSLAKVLDSHTGHEAWFCLSRFRAGTVTKAKTGETIDVPDNYRNGGVFEYAVGLGVDIDTEGHRDLTPEERKALKAAARAGELPGALFYDTPAGARLLRLLEEPVYDPTEFRELATEFENQVYRALSDSGFDTLRIDSQCTTDRARFYYTPKATAKGRKRTGEIILIPLLSTHDGELRELTSPYSPHSPSLHSPSQPVLEEVSDSQREGINRLIKRSLPAGKGNRRTCLRMYIRGLKALPFAERIGAPSNLKPFVMAWWQEGKPGVNHRDLDGEETWEDFLVLWPGATAENTALIALDHADDNPDPMVEVVVRYLGMENPGFRRLVGMICALDQLKDGGKWFVSTEYAAELLGFSEPTMRRWLREILWKKYGVITQVEAPKYRERRAARYVLNRDWQRG
jgi:hypothetical protein